MSRDPDTGAIQPPKLRAAAVAAVWGSAFALGMIATAVATAALASLRSPQPDDGIFGGLDAVIAAVIGIPVTVVIAIVTAA